MSSKERLIFQNLPHGRYQDDIFIFLLKYVACYKMKLSERRYNYDKDDICPGEAV